MENFVKMIVGSLLSFIALNTVGFLQVTHALNREVQLTEDLFRNYNLDVRPVENHTDAVEVMFGMALNQIVDVKEKSEYISISVFLKQLWTDANLKWTPANYDNVTTINVNSDRIWKPDIVLYNNVDEDKSFGGSLDQLHNRAIIKHTGEVKWLTPVILSAKCPMNVRYFPFDTQTCKLKFGSWTYDGFKLDMHKLTEKVDLSTYQGHSEWYLENTYIEKNVVTYGCCPEPFPDITIVLVMKRRSLFYLINLIFPMVVISMLTMLSFYLPAEAGERIALAITLLLAMTVFMLIVGEIIPSTSDAVPLVASFFSSVIVEMVLMIIILCYILKLHFKSAEDEPMPQWMRRFILESMSYTLRIQKPPKNRMVNKINHNKKTDKKLDRRMKSISTIYSGADIIDRTDTDNCTTVTYVKNGRIHTNHDVDNTIENCFLASPLPKISQKELPLKNSNPSLRMINRKLDAFLERFADEDEEDFIKREWRICALTLDRMSLIFFGVVFIITTLSCFMSAPGYTP